MKVSVDNGICDARGQCYIVDPELFTLDDEGYSDIGQDKPVPVGKEHAARMGVQVCPVHALSLEEDESS